MTLTTLRRLAAHLETVREQERTNLAREVHDELGQVLTVLKMEAEGLAAQILHGNEERAELLRRVHSIIGHIEIGMAWARRISAELRPGVLDHLGLAAAIEWQAGEFQARTGIRCTVDLARCPALDERASTGVFRIFQGLLENIARDSGATAVLVQTNLKPGGLVLNLRHNGRGIGPGSLALLEVRERARALGGTIEFRGTAVRLSIPLPHAAVESRPPIEAHAPTERAHTVPFQSLRILLADDHAMVRQGLKEILLRAFSHASIGEACDGQEALDMMKASDWDVAILDISMPRKTGLDVLSELRQTGSAVPVLVLSMHSEADYGRRVIEAGGSGFINKARAAQNLVAAVRHALSGEALPAASRQSGDPVRR